MDGTPNAYYSEFCYKFPNCCLFSRRIIPTDRIPFISENLSCSLWFDFRCSKKTVKAFDISYHENDTFTSVFASHYSMLNKTGILVFERAYLTGIFSVTGFPVAISVPSIKAYRTFGSQNEPPTILTKSLLIRMFLLLAVTITIYF